MSNKISEADLQNYDEAVDEVHAANRVLKEVKNRLAEKYAAYPIGSEAPANGYVHENKTIIVDKVYLKRWLRDEIMIFHEGYIVKKDGTVGKQRAEHALVIHKGEPFK